MHFNIPGRPQGKARARTLKNGHSYTPENTVLYENLIILEYKRQCGNVRFGTMPNSDLKQPLHMTITAVYPIPKSFNKRKKQEAERNLIRPTVKPDADNVAKVVCDALNGIAYIDDTQVVELDVFKLYGKQPHVDVDIEKITPIGVNL